ncbi:MAG: hypothetical protein HC840_10015 [Leptolyngbyaceae cyanobacterium RM2_2_4]|nr:hypothetical protein [Leptolyngbyaceae cyanobacterium RM2_2_4]
METLDIAVVTYAFRCGTRGLNSFVSMAIAWFTFYLRKSDAGLRPPTYRKAKVCLIETEALQYFK